MCIRRLGTYAIVIITLLFGAHGTPLPSLASWRPAIVPRANDSKWVKFHCIELYADLCAVT